MIADPTTATTVTLVSGDLSILAYLVQPPGVGPWLGVVVIQEVFGVTAHIQSVCQRLAGVGYLANCKRRVSFLTMVSLWQ